MIGFRGSLPVALVATVLAAVPAPAATEGEGLYVVRLESRIAPEDRAALASVVEQILDYEPRDSYVVWASSSQIEAATKLPAVLMADPVTAARKLSPNLTDAQGMVVAEVTMVRRVEGQTRAALARLTPVRASTIAETRDGYISAVVAVPASALSALAGLPGVIHVGRASPGLVPEDEMSDQIVAGNMDPTSNRPVAGYGAWLEEHGLDGGGIRVAVVDTGIQSAHPDLASRTEKPVDYMTPAQPGDAIGHGTHVAGIIGGAPPAGILPADLDGFVYGLGVAPATTLLDLNGIGLASVFSSTGPRTSLDRYARDAWRNGARMWNGSWQTAEGIRVGYNASTRLMDVLSRDADLQAPGSEEFLFVFSAGNEGTDGPTVPKEAKNLISVGATESGRGLVWPLTSDIDEVSSSSSRGPTLDGRVFPTVVAPGWSVVSARAPEGALSCREPVLDGAGLYAYCSGTSMAAPHVTGAAALIHQWWDRERGGLPSPAMVRALLVNSATDIGVPDIPNRDEGWGRINLGSLFGAPPEMVVDQDEVFTEAGQEAAYQLEVTDRGPLRVTLAWSDAPGGFGADPALVNDLDLRVERLGETGDVVAGWRGNRFSQGVSVAGGDPDRLNNIENVFLGDAEPGRYVIIVEAFNLPGDGVPHDGVPIDQDFALVVRGP